MTGRLIEIGAELIDPNPHRNLSTYPWIEKKLEHLQRSIEDVGLWEGIIARPHGKRYELAFGHHRLEAARRCGKKKIPVIVRDDLSDEDMLKLMGRENGEDYSTDFIVMLNTWEGAVKYSEVATSKIRKPIDIARILGWTVISGSKHEERMGEVAKACAAAHALIVGGYISRDDLSGLSVKSAKEIVTGAQSRMEIIERAARETNRPAKEVEQAKKHVAKGAKITAREHKEGKVAQRDLKAEVDINAYRAAVTSKTKDSPLFAAFGKSLADSINKSLRSDSIAERLGEIAKAVNVVTLAEDHAVLRQIDFELAELGVRAEGWRKRIIPIKAKVVGLLQLENKSNA